MREGSRNWKRPEMQFLLQMKATMQHRFNMDTFKHEVFWKEISAKMKERGFDRSTEACIRKWRNLVRGSKKPRENEPLRHIYEQIEKLCNAQPGNETVRRKAKNIDKAATIGQSSNKEDKDEITEAKENKHISLAHHHPLEPVLGEANSEILEPQLVANQHDDISEARENNLISFPSQEPEELAIPTNDFISFPLDGQPDLSIDAIPTTEFSFGDNDDAFLALLSPYQDMEVVPSL